MNWGRAETRLNAKRIVIQLDSCLWQIHVCERKTCSQTSHDEVHFFIVRFCHLLYEKLYLLKKIKNLKLKIWKFKGLLLLLFSGSAKICSTCHRWTWGRGTIGGCRGGGRTWFPYSRGWGPDEVAFTDTTTGEEKAFPKEEGENLTRGGSPQEEIITLSFLSEI